MKNETRNIGIDMLRIVSMFMICVLHVLGCGGILEATQNNPIKSNAMWLLEIIAFCATNCYGLISGYVGFFSKYKYSNLAILWLRTAFYSVIITVIFFAFSPETVSWKRVLLSFIPVLSNQYWYFTAYFILFLFIPVLNAAVENISQKRLKVTLILIIFLFCIVFCTYKGVADTFVIRYGSSAWWLMILYLLGAYIRKYGMFENTKSTVLIIIFFSSTFLTLLSRIIIRLITVIVFSEARYTEMWVSCLSIFILIESITLLLLFKRIKINRTGIKIISLLSPLAFSVYLIHTHPCIFDNILKDAFIWVADISLFFMIPVVLGISTAIFILCCLIDTIRELLFRIVKLKERLAQLEIKIATRVSSFKLLQ